jgi:hypothetical protein
MFIAWKEKPYGLTASLQGEVRSSYRSLASRTPVSGYVCYLGSIRLDLIDDIVANHKFWEKATLKIDCLDISEDDKRHLRQLLSERVPNVKVSAPTAPLPVHIKRLLRKGRKMRGTS